MAESNDIALLRAQVFQRLLLAVVVLGGITAVPSVVLAASERLWPIAIMDTVAMVWLITIWRWTGMRYALRVFSFLAVAFIVGVGLQAKQLPVSQVYLTAVPVLAALLLGLRPALYWLAASGGAIIVFAVAPGSLALPWQQALPALLKACVIGLNFLFITGMITLSCGFLLRHLQRSLDAMETGRLDIHRLANYDVLTGLPNRRMLTDHIDRLLESATRAAHFGAVIYVDLDHFKDINDARGHALGDALLCEAAARLTVLMRKGDVVARVGGDEFVVLLAQLGSERGAAAHMARAMADKIRTTLGEPFDVQGEHYQSSASLGVTLLPQAGRASEDLLREADTAMYRAKAGGRNGIAFFEDAMQAEVEQRLDLARRLAQALELGQLQMHFQPQLDREARIVGAELLMRWRLPDGTMVAPNTFIPIAEQSGLIISLGQWALREACNAVVKLAAAGHPIALSVNVSPVQFRQPDFVAQVRATLAASGAPANMLILEVTEGLLIEKIDETVGRMNELTALGLRFSIDDFGTGYSSLAYLRRMPLYELKIDRSFIHDTPDNPNGAAIVQAILAMARHLQLRVVAEGVETEDQSRFLMAHGCDCQQGYLHARPAPFAELLARITS